MAEGRMIKRRICESKKLGALSTHTARLLYTWLIPWLDSEGRYVADPEILKGHIFPKIKDITPEMIDADLAELKNEKLIYLYSVDGEDYLQFRQNLQKIRKDREAESKIPAPPATLLEDSGSDPGAGQEQAGNTPAEIKLNKSKLNQINSILTNRESVIMEPWNIFAEKYGLPQIQGIQEKTPRYRYLKARLKEGMEFKDLLEIVRNSPFLLGKNDQGFTATFDWILKPTNYLKILEGNYLDRKRRHQGLRAFAGKD
jgi:hypothetical protein